jgi:magnesium transporter
MLETHQDISEEIGRMPEEALFIGEKKVDHLSIDVFEYGNNDFKEFIIEDIREILPLNENLVTWITVIGLHDNEQVKEIGALFNIHPLVVEDILNTKQRPKIEDYDDYIFITTKTLRYENDDILSEQVSIILGENFVITFQEIKMDIFEHIRHRIRRKRGRIYRSGADYLSYLLVDTVVENYVLITETIGEKIEDLEDKYSGGDSLNVVESITLLKKELSFLRKIIRPTSEFILQMNSLDSDLIDESTEPFFKDLLDISVRSNESVEICRDMLSDNLQVYNLDLANRFNEILKLLTMFSAVFIPLSFIASVYGMNFDYMPELRGEYSYHIVLGVMACIVVSLFLYFKRRKWL